MWKKGFTLVEMVIVITVIGLLTAYLIPKVTSAQARARDIARKADITAISTALVQYKQDHGEFPNKPKNSGRQDWFSMSKLYNDYLSWYLSNIPQDPSNKWFEEAELKDRWCSNWYCYLSDWNIFLLAYAVDNPENGNYACYFDDDICWRYPLNLRGLKSNEIDEALNWDYSKFIKAINENQNHEYRLGYLGDDIDENNQITLEALLNQTQGTIWFKKAWLTPWYSQNNYFVYIYE